MGTVPQELIDYLVTLISPPGMRASYYSSVEELLDGPMIEEESLCGLIVQGTPTEFQARSMKAILMPGAHLILIAPEQEPTGHTGACNLERAGLEIRDSILCIQEAGRSFYVPKASVSERRRGVENLVVHPTMKPIALMRKLLEDVPKDGGPVMDTFAGSGSTGVACLESGHDFLGLDKEQDFVELSTARISYWAEEHAGYIPREIISDFPMEPSTKVPKEIWELED